MSQNKPQYHKTRSVKVIKIGTWRWFKPWIFFHFILSLNSRKSKSSSFKLVLTLMASIKLELSEWSTNRTADNTNRTLRQYKRHRGIFRTLPNIHDGVILRKTLTKENPLIYVWQSSEKTSETVRNVFSYKIQSYMFIWILFTSNLTNAHPVYYTKANQKLDYIKQHIPQYLPWSGKTSLFPKYTQLIYFLE